MQQIKELLELQTKTIHDGTKENSMKFLHRMPEQQIILTTFAAVTAVQKSMHDTLLKLGIDENLVKEIEGVK